ncbi:hypothetical protein HHL17_04860 [Chitinophaga sp. G-6-1-13]|uniref:Lipoprotein n=1 Tax=Chitinophaga fulva TaxID=2728842 RepID=A0A848GIH7_9BACT|nr:hypothetical protein [Chitinophaga fulva]NML36520.1 hypothetical protein [Chitinophaga fulva]
MPRILPGILLVALLAGSCSHKEKSPCNNNDIATLKMAIQFTFRLTDPQTGADLVSGPGATIPLDSVRLIRPNGQSGYWVEKASRSTGATYLKGPVAPSMVLEVGQTGRVAQYKINMTFREAGCSNELVGVTLGDNAVPLKKDSTYAYLIPFSR